MHRLKVSEPGSFKLCVRADLEDEAVSEIRAIAALVRGAMRPFAPCGLLLTGSFARGEGTIVSSDAGSVRWLSDIECLLVLDDGSPARQVGIHAALSNACAAINQDADRRAKGLKVDLSPIGVRQLARMRPAIFSNELRIHGKLLWGEPAVIRMPAEISPQFDLRRDALRLLHNRIVEKLAVRARLSRPGTQPVEAWYTLSKFWLDLATSLLTFLGHYRTSYAERSELVESVLVSHRAIFAPAMTETVVERIREASAIKLGLMKPVETDLTWRFDEAAEAAEQAWDWESQRLLKIESSDRQWARIGRRLRRIESARQRARDWGRLLLRSRRTVRVNPVVLASMFRAGSFGSAIYTAACLLDFYWTAIASGEGPGGSIRRKLGRLFTINVADADGLRQVTELMYNAWQHHLRSSAL